MKGPSIETEGRALRIVVGSLLTSDLTLSELEAVAERFRDREFCYAIFSALADSSSNLRSRAEKKRERVIPHNPNEASIGDISQRILSAIRRKKLSREKASRKIGASLNIEPSMLLSAYPNMEGMVEFASTQASSTKLRKLLADLSEGDAYLKGISNR